MNTCESKNWAVHVRIVLKVSRTWGRLAVCEEVGKTCGMSEEHMGCSSECGIMTEDVGCQYCMWGYGSACVILVVYVGLWHYSKNEIGNKNSFLKLS